MERGSRAWIGRSRGLLALALIALALRVFVPDGFMLNAGATPDSPPRIVICTGQGPMVVSEPGASASDKPAPGPRKAEHCVSAGLPTPLPPPLAVAAAPTAFVVVEAPARPVAHQRPGLGLAAPPPPKTGPPAFA